MRITSTDRPATQVPCDVLAVPYLEGESPSRGVLKDIDRALGGELARAVERGELTGRYDYVDRVARRLDLETLLWPGGDLAAGRVLLIGAGPRAEYDAERARKIAGTAARHVRSRFANVALLARSDAHVEAMVEGFVVGDHEPDLHKATRKPSRVTDLTLIAAGDVRKAVDAGRIIGDATNAARTLVNEPPNVITPTALAGRAKDMLTQAGVKVDVLTGNKLERFGGLLGVAKGSDEPPAFITMRWDPPRARKAPVLGIVGKGITFDSGGLSLKPNEGMQWMKGDMAGAAATISAMRAIADLKLPLRVVAAVPATENMPSGKATRVGDVLTHYSGKTSEILNTDAEGRLVLADALAWIAEQGVTHVVDAATLTGAVEIALGKVAFGVMGRPDAFVDRVLRSSRRAGEKCWPLPLYKDYRELIVSEIADVKNTGGRPAGTITAAWFLAEFVPPDVQWAHLDIAGVAWTEGVPWRASGATGAGTRAFVRIAQDLAGGSGGGASASERAPRRGRP